MSAPIDHVLYAWTDEDGDCCFLRTDEDGRLVLGVSDNEGTPDNEVYVDSPHSRALREALERLDISRSP